MNSCDKLNMISKVSPEPVGCCRLTVSSGQRTPTHRVKGGTVARRIHIAAMICVTSMLWTNAVLAVTWNARFTSKRAAFRRVQKLAKKHQCSVESVDIKGRINNINARFFFRPNGSLKLVILNGNHETKKTAWRSCKIAVSRLRCPPDVVAVPAQLREAYLFFNKNGSIERCEWCPSHSSLIRREVMRSGEVPWLKRFGLSAGQYTVQSNSISDGPRGEKRYILIILPRSAQRQRSLPKGGTKTVQKNRNAAIKRNRSAIVRAKMILQTRVELTSADYHRLHETMAESARLLIHDEKPERNNGLQPSDTSPFKASLLEGIKRESMSKEEALQPLATLIRLHSLKIFLNQEKISLNQEKLEESTRTRHQEEFDNLLETILVAGER